MTPSRVRTGAAPSRRTPVSSGRRLTGLIVCLVALVVVTLLSVAIGSETIGAGTVLHDLFQAGSDDSALIVRGLRVPRTLLGLAVGVALGVAGALIQALTRNPLADPGLLGVNAGAALAVVAAVGMFGLTSPSAYIWFSLLGAGGAAILVYLLGSGGRANAATPVRLALAGTAMTAVIGAVISGITSSDQAALDRYRFWAVGSLAGRDLSVLGQIVPFLALGVILAASLGPSLNALALGDDAGRGLGAHPGRVRAGAGLAVTLLCGGATAAAGPIGFVGLTVPHMARAITGPDQRWVMAYSAVLAPILLLAADVVGRVVARPAEIQVGVVTAFLGAPVFLWLIRRRRVAAL